MLSYESDYGKPVQYRHVDVEQDQIGFNFVYFGECFFSTVVKA